MRSTRYWIVGVTGLLALVFSGAAWGKCGHHHTKGNPTVSQYVEQIHTSCGSTAVGSTATGSGGSSVSPVTPSATTTHSVHRSISGPKVKSIATDSALGAQPKDLRGDAGTLGGGGNPLSASLGALAGGSGVRLLLLLVLMGGAAVALLAASIFRRRSSR